MTMVDIDSIKVVGIATRTSYRIESSTKAKIPGLWRRFSNENIASKVPLKLDPSKIFAIYTEYDSDEHGAFTFILGVEVPEFSEIPEGMIGKTIKKSNYEVKESDEGPFQEVVSKVWKTVSKDLNLKDRRKYETDFESYDTSEDSSKGTVKVYLSIA